MQLYKNVSGRNPGLSLYVLNHYVQIMNCLENSVRAKAFEREPESPPGHPLEVITARQVEEETDELNPI